MSDKQLLDGFPPQATPSLPEVVSSVDAGDASPPFRIPDHKMRIIGLTGEARAGKDTVAKMIEQHYYLAEVVRTGFAWKLKLSAMRIFHPNATQEMALEWADWLKTQADVVIEETDVIGVTNQITGRAFLQNYGTEAHRDTFGEDFWLDAVLWAGRDDCDILVISDARFENEVQRIRDRGGEVWRVERPGNVNPDAVGAHASEQRIPDEYVTTTIVNDGSLRDLEAKVLEAL
jgi:hypothetical protein